MPPHHRTTRIRVRVLRTARHSPYLTATQIANIVGCHPSTVHKHLHTRPNTDAVFARASQRARQAETAPNGTTLTPYARGSDHTARRAAARNAHCPPPQLARLAADPAWSARRAAAANAHCPPTALSRLAADPDPDVRRAATVNQNCSPETLTRAATDENWRVRAAAAGNPNSPPTALSRLAADPDPDVRHIASRNPNRIQ